MTLSLVIGIIVGFMLTTTVLILIEIYRLKRALRAVKNIDRHQ